MVSPDSEVAEMVSAEDYPVWVVVMAVAWTV